MIVRYVAEQMGFQSEDVKDGDNTISILSRQSYRCMYIIQKRIIFSTYIPLYNNLREATTFIPFLIYDAFLRLSVEICSEAATRLDPRLIVRVRETCYNIIGQHWNKLRQKGPV
jgi:hypothetical protein